MLIEDSILCMSRLNLSVNSLHVTAAYLSAVIVSGRLLVRRAIAILPLLIPLRRGQPHAVYAVIQHAVSAISKHALITPASAATKTAPATPTAPASTPLIFMP